MSDKVPLLAEGQGGEVSAIESVVRQRTNRRGSEKKSSLASAMQTKPTTDHRHEVSKSDSKKTHFARFLDNCDGDAKSGLDEGDRKASFDTDLEEDLVDEDGDTEEDIRRYRKAKGRAKRRMIYLAKKIAPDSLLVRIIEATVVITTISFAIYMYCYFDNVHYHITHGYAKLGYSAAQHQMGQRYLNGAGVEKDQWTAMHWFKKASDQGHPHAAYNVAVGHLQGIRTDLLRAGEAHELIKHAAVKGVKEAHEAIADVCNQGGCD